MTEAPRTPVITLDNVVVRSGKRLPLAGVTHAFYPGDLVFIICRANGPRQLLSRLLAGQLFPDDGRLARNGATGPIPGAGMGFQGSMSSLRGLEMRAAAHGVDYYAYVDAVAGYLRNPEILRKPFSSLSGAERNMVLFSSAYLLPATHYVTETLPLPHDARVQRRLGGLYEAARERAAIICIPRKEPAPSLIGDAQVLYLHEGQFSETPPPKPEKRKKKRPE